MGVKEKMDNGKKKIDAYLTKRGELEEYMGKEGVREIVDNLRLLIQEHNKALQEAIHAFRKEVHLSDGPKKDQYRGFKVTRIFKQADDPKTLIKEIGKEELQSSGALVEKTTYKVVREALLKMIADGRVPHEVYVKACADVESTPQVRTPYNEYLL